MNKTNFKKIKSRFNGSYIWWGVFYYAVGMLLLLIILKDYAAEEFLYSFVVLAILYLVFVLIGVLLASMIRGSILKKKIMSQGDIASFNNESFMEVGLSRQLFVSDNWLLWNRGMEYRIYHRSHIRGAYTHPNQRPGNRYAVCDLYLDSKERPLNLYYTYEPGIDLPGMLQGWLGMGANRVQSTEVPMQQVYPQAAAMNTAAYCSNCGTALKPNAHFCTNCGSAVR